MELFGGSWLWSVVALVLFYAPLTYAAAFSPGWLVAGTWQLTILAGVLLTPLFFITIKTKDDTQRVRQKNTDHFFMDYIYHFNRRRIYSNSTCPHSFFEKPIIWRITYRIRSFYVSTWQSKND